MKAAGRSPSAAAAVAKGSAAAAGGDIERHETGSALADDRRRRRWMNASLLPSPPFVLRFYCLASQICWCSCEDTFAACLILLPPRHLARQPVVVDTKSLFIPEAKPYLKAPKRHVFFPSRQILIWFARFAPLCTASLLKKRLFLFFFCLPFHQRTPYYILFAQHSFIFVNLCGGLGSMGAISTCGRPALAATSTLPPKPLPLPPSLATTTCCVEFFSLARLPRLHSCCDCKWQCRSASHAAYILFGLRRSLASAGRESGP